METSSRQAGSWGQEGLCQSHWTKGWNRPLFPSPVSQRHCSQKKAPVLCSQPQGNGWAPGRPLRHRGLAPGSLVSSKSFQPIQTPLNINSRTEKEMWRLHFLKEGKNNVLARPYLESWILLSTAFRGITGKLEAIQRTGCAREPDRDRSEGPVNHSSP